MKFVYKLLKQDPDSREGIIAVTSGLGIFVNVVLATVKIIIGVLASSIAIISEGINNFADVVSALLTLIGAKLARMHNNANIVAFGARVIGQELAAMIVDEFLNAEFEGGRHQRRVDLITAIEEGTI